MFIIKNHFRQTQVGTKFAQESWGRPIRSSKQHISGSVSQRAPSASIHEPSIMSDSHSLAGGIPTPLKNMSSSAGIMIPNIWKNKSHVPHHQPVPNVFPYFEANTIFWFSTPPFLAAYPWPTFAPWGKHDMRPIFRTTKREYSLFIVDFLI